MHQLTIVFGPASTIWWTLFKEQERADKVLEELKTAIQTQVSHTTIIDDFGQQATLAVVDIHGFLLEDLEKSKVAQIERSLHQMRTEIRCRQMAEADPVLKAAMMARGSGISVISPMPGGGRFG